MPLLKYTYSADGAGDLPKGEVLAESAFPVELLQGRRDQVLDLLALHVGVCWAVGTKLYQSYCRDC